MERIWVKCIFMPREVIIAVIDPAIAWASPLSLVDDKTQKEINNLICLLNEHNNILAKLDKEIEKRSNSLVSIVNELKSRK